MAEIPDLSSIPDDVRKSFAAQIKAAEDFELPVLSIWNYEPCAKHETIEEGANSLPPCRNCGILLHKHQRIGAAWAFFSKKVLIADQTGLGKSGIMAFTLAMAIEAGELEGDRKIVMIVNAAQQWETQLKRMMPNVTVHFHNEIKSKRIAKLLHTEWQICLTSPMTFNNDLELFRSIDIHTVLIDDIDPLRSSKTITADRIKQICWDAERVIQANATPLDKRLIQLYSILEPIGGREVFHSKESFEHQYIQYQFSYNYDPSLRRDVASKSVAFHKNIPDLIEKLSPLVIRRTAADLDDISMPELVPDHIYLNLYPAQRKKYEELKKGAIKILKEDGTSLTRTKANNCFMLGQKIVDGLSVLGQEDTERSSVKLDYLEAMLTGDLVDEKVVVFMQFKTAIRSLQARLDRLGIGYGTYWGEDADKASRQRTQDEFNDNPSIRVLMGTSSLSASLNLQISRHMIAFNTLMSPGKMQQIAGRTNRLSSAYKVTYFHSLLTQDTQESRYVAKLQREGALSDVVLDGNEGGLYNLDLSPQEVLRLVTG